MTRPLAICCSRKLHCRSPALRLCPPRKTACTLSLLPISAGQPALDDRGRLRAGRPNARPSAPGARFARPSGWLMPIALISRTSRKTSRTTIGARPSEGSSISRSFGRRDQRARDRNHLLLAAATASRRPGRGARAAAGSARTSHRCGARRGPCRSTAKPPMPQVVHDGERVPELPTLGHPGHARARWIWCGFRRSRSCSPLKRISPARGRSRPNSVLMMVVLPAPLAPRMTRSSPGKISSETPSTAGTAPYDTARPLTSSSARHSSDPR